MKQCPKCSRTYSDDTLAYCLDDGGVLVARQDPAETLRIPSARPTDWPTPTPASMPPYATPRRSKWPIIILVTLLLIGLLVGAVGIVIFAYSRMSAPSIANNQPPTDKQPDSWTSPSPSPAATPRTSASVVGTWRTRVYENGQNMEISVTFLSDGNTRYAFKDDRGRTGADTGTWQYSDGILYEKFSNGASGKGSIRWIDDNTVELTIIDNGVPAYSGVKRIYRRVT